MKRLSGVQTGSLISEGQNRQGGVEHEEALLWRNRPKANWEGLNLPQPWFSQVTRIPTDTDPATHHTFPSSSASVQVPVTSQGSAGKKSQLTDPSKSKMNLFYPELALY